MRNEKTIALFLSLFLALLPAFVQADVSLTFGEAVGQARFFNQRNHPGTEESPAVGPMSFRALPDRLLVLDSLGGKIMDFTHDGKLQREIPITAPGQETFLSDFAVTIDESGKPTGFWILDDRANHILHTDFQGKPISRIDRTGVQGDGSGGGFAQLERIECGPSGTVYVGDLVLKKILVYSPQGTLLRYRKWYGGAFAVDRQDRLHYLTVDRGRKVFNLVGETPTGNVCVFAPLTSLPAGTWARIEWIDDQGVLLITMTPDKTGTPPRRALFRVSPDGKIIAKGDLALPPAMNRFIDGVPGKSTAWVGVGNFAKVPKETFTFKTIGLPQ